MSTPVTDTPARLVPSVDGAYRSPQRRASLLERAFPTPLFYRRFFSIVWKASRLARLGRYDGDAWARSSFDVLRTLERLGVQFEMTGLDRIERLDQPYLLVGNHMSSLETTILPCMLQPIRDVTFVVKPDLLTMPVFRHVMRSRNPIAVSQTNPREDLKTMLSGGTERLERGVSLVVFPQGTRMSYFDAADFNTIGVKLAQRAGVPIVPLALQTDAWSVGRRVPDLGRIYPERKVRFAFGEPLRVEGRGGDQQAAIVDFLRGQLRAWGVDVR